MWPYWLFFCTTIPLAFFDRWHRPLFSSGLHQAKLDVAWTIAVFVLTSLIGFRLEVGGDWDSYLDHLYKASYLPITDLVEKKDPGYQLLNWLSSRLGWGIYGVNLTCGALFSVGLAKFCRGLPRPWLALTVAMPYLVIVVAMGYSRQGVALGLAMLGLVALGKKEIWLFVFWVALSATFHKSAILLLPIAILATTRNRYWTMVWVGIVTSVIYLLFLEKSVGNFYTSYIEAKYQSQGAIIRLLMNAVPAFILLFWHRRFRFAETEASLWRWFSILSIGLLAVVIVSPSTTALDRVALYMIPLQLVVFSHFPDIFGRNRRRNEGLIIAISLYYAVVQFVWLNYASNAFSWLPYRFYPFEAWL